MRVFEPLQELELYTDDNQLLGVYLPGSRYYCENGTILAQALERWLFAGLVKLVDIRNGTRPAMLGGIGEVI